MQYLLASSSKRTQEKGGILARRASVDLLEERNVSLKKEEKTDA